jgi:hypothetical protein
MIRRAGGLEVGQWVHHRLDLRRGLVSWFAHSDFVIEYLLLSNGPLGLGTVVARAVAYNK